MHVVIEIKGRLAAMRPLSESIDDDFDYFIGNSLNVRCFENWNFQDFPSHPSLYKSAYARRFNES